MVILATLYVYQGISELYSSFRRTGTGMEFKKLEKDEFVER